MPLTVTSAGAQAGERVGDGQAEVVVAVHGDDHVLGTGRVLDDAGDKRAELVRHRVTDGVRDVERGGAGLDDGGEHLVEKFRVAAAGVLRRELDIRAQRARIGDHLDGLGGHLLARHAELVLEVEVAGREEGVDARVLGALHALPGGIDVVLGAARETADDRRLGLRTSLDRGLADLGRDGLDGREVVGRGGREAGLNDVDAEARERARDLELLGGVHGGAGRLFTVAERGVEDSNVGGRRSLHGE